MENEDGPEIQGDGDPTPDQDAASASSVPLTAGGKHGVHPNGKHGTNNPKRPCVECGSPKEPGSRKARCEECIAKFYYVTPKGHVLRKIPCRCGSLKEKGRWYCDDCKVVIVAEWTAEAKDKQRDRYLQAQYGITQARYLEIFEEQGGVCAICKRPAQAGRKNLDVDHCHKTGALRGLLCGRCNQQVLPIAKDDSVLLRAAADYLEREPLGWCPQREDLPSDLLPYLRKQRDEYRPLKELPPWMGRSGKKWD